jgi:CheY-like chemotaxis protein
MIRAVARLAGREESVAPREPVRPEKVGGRVLVVDDNSVNRKILARQLELAGASTDAASGGEEALELWRTGRYDLVLADLQMPTMDGFELARRIRSSEAAEHRARTPILAVTASAFEDQERMSRDVGMDGLITKPIGIEQLRATLDIWLKDARVEQPT